MVDARSRIRRERLALLAMGGLVFGSRVPFLLPGYGSEPDAWRIAAVARQIAMTGEYAVSRFPGYPVHEVLSSLFIGGGPLALNGASALMSALAFYDFKPWSWRVVLEVGGAGVWGRVGVIALVLALLSMLIPRRQGSGSTSIPSSGSLIPVIAWTIAIVLYGAAFLRLPDRSGYLIPAVPFMILLIGRVVRRPVFIGLCALLVGSSFVSIGRTGLGAGPIFEDHSYRRSMMQYTDTVLAAGGRLRARTVVVAGGWLPLIQGTASELSVTPVEYVDVLDRHGVQDYLSRGYRICYLANANQHNIVVHAVNLDRYGGCELATCATCEPP